MRAEGGPELFSTGKKVQGQAHGVSLWYVEIHPCGLTHGPGSTIPKQQLLS